MISSVSHRSTKSRFKNRQQSLVSAMSSGWSLAAVVLCVSLNNRLAHANNSSDVSDSPETHVKRTNYVYPMLGGNFSKPPIVVYPMDDRSRSGGHHESRTEWQRVTPFNSGTSGYSGMRYVSHFPEASVDWNTMDTTRGRLPPPVPTSGDMAGGRNETASHPSYPPHQDRSPHQADYGQTSDVNPSLNSDPRKRLTETAITFSNHESGYHHPHHHQEYSSSVAGSNDNRHLIAARRPVPPYESFRISSSNAGNSYHPDANQHTSASPALEQQDRRAPEITPEIGMQSQQESGDQDQQDQELDRSLTQAYQYHERQLYQRFQDLCLQIRGYRCDQIPFQPQSVPQSYPMSPPVRLPGYGYRY